ncbi:MAG TPA: glycosyltransferase family 2 protein, partial [Anaerolineales bacterium]|nr:glycosyltransferase family 2 protein [Anaerolineales bacterium]
MNFSKFNLAVVIPAYRTEKEILAVLQGIPTFIRHIIVVDDASPDSSADLVTTAAKKNRHILLIRHTKNQGVGGAMVTGFKKALELGAEIVIKLDGDGQMDPHYIPALITPLITGEADYAKGNRFRDFDALRQMPIVRRIGNLGLSFLTKAATGYWNIFDPTNGYFAIRAEMLAQLPLDQIDKGYYFETSMLSRLYLRDAFVQDVTIPARYRNEVSSLSIKRVLFEFPYKLTRTLIKRIIL